MAAKGKAGAAKNALTGGQPVALPNRVRELEQTEARFRELVERSPQAVVVHDAKLLYANEAAAALFGYDSVDALLSLPSFVRLYTPPARKMARERRQARLRGEPVEPIVEMPVLCADGTRREVLVHTREIEWGGSRAVHCAYTDLTEYRRIQAEQAEDRQLLRTVLDAVPHWVVVKDVAGRNVLSNRAVFQALGVTPDELYGSNAREIGPVGPGEVELTERTDHDVLTHGRTIVIHDHPYTLPDGTQQRRHLIKTPLRDAAGSIQGLIGVSIDLTAQWEAQQQLRRSEERLRTLVDHLPVIVATCDGQGTITAVEGAGAGALHGLGRLVGRPLADVLAGEPVMAEAVQGALRGEPGQAMWYPGDRAFDSRFMPVRDEADAVSGVLWLALEVTERVRAQREGEVNRQLLEVVVDTIPHLVFVKDRESRYLLVNRAKLELHQTTAEALIGQPHDQVPIGTPEERADMRRADEEVFRTGRNLDQPDMPVTLPDGTTRIMKQVKVPLRDERGEIFGLVGVAEDVTEAQRAAEELRAQRRLLQAVFDVVPVWLFVKDRESRMLMVNDTMARRLGRDRDRIQGLAHDLVPVGLPAERDKFLSDDRRVVENGESVDVEEAVTLHGGPTVMLHSRKVPLRDDSGQIIGLVGMSEDITERLQAEEELRTQRRLLQTVFDALPTWLFVKDRDSRYVMVNEQFAREVGRTTEDFRALAHTGAPHGTAEERAWIQEVEARLVETGTPYEGEEDLTLPDGRKTYRFVRKVPLRDDDGQIVGLVGISEDITARRDMEEQIRRMQRIESIGTLAGGIAHDFNNILFPIIGLTELTMMELDRDSGAYRNLNTVRDAALRAKDIVSQILAFSRQVENKPEVVQLRPLVRESLRFLGSTLPSTVRIEESLERDVAPVYADAVQMHQVLMNLCVNAAHAMPDGGRLRVTLQTRELVNFKGYTGEPASGRYVRLAVSDSGTGIDPITLARIFEPFFTTKSVGQGTGLGLSTVLGIVTQHKGVVNVITAPGEGATFEVYLPAVSEAAQTEAVPPGVSKGPVQGSILYVDDEPHITELACKVLENAGHRVVGLTNSSEALAVLRRDPDAFDLLITDQTMPGLTGDRLAAEARALRPELAIVIGTGYGHAIPPGLQSELGLAEVFVKPVTGEQLARIVARVLAARADPDPAAAGA